MDPLHKAFAQADRSYSLAKQAVQAQADELLAAGPTGAPFADAFKSGSAKQQLDAFRSWVFAAIRPICNRIARQPIRLARMRSSRRGKPAQTPEVIDEHPLLRVIGNPNDLMTSWGLKWVTAASVCLTGKAFWWLLPEEGQIHYLPPHWITGFEGTARFEAWKVRPPGKAEELHIPSNRMVYFALPDPSNPWDVVSPIQAVAEAVNNDADILQSQRSAFRRGLFPMHAVFVGKDANGVRPRLTPAQQRQLVTAIRNRYSGAAKMGEPFIVDAAIEDIRPLTHKPDEMAWEQCTKDVKQRIMEAFGVSPYILGTTEPGSRAASAMSEKHFVANAVGPLCEMMSAAMQEWLLPAFAPKESLKIWIELPTPDDVEMQYKRMYLALLGGVVDANELRMYAGLPERDEYEGVIAALNNPRRNLSDRLQQPKGAIHHVGGNGRL